MKVALVHDYIKEFGGAERVLKRFSEIYKDAPIYTAFKVSNSTAGKEFENRKICESFLAPILKIGKLYSPLRFLIPIIWHSFDLKEYDLIIVSSSWYDIRSLRVNDHTKVVVYCHTPPRWLYGYETSVHFTKYLPVKIYAAVVGHFMRIWDWYKSQDIKYWIANSLNVQKRIEKFYRKESTVIYPPCDVENIISKTRSIKKEDYFLIVSRLVGAKGLQEAAMAAKNKNFKLKIVGEAHGFSDVKKHLKELSGDNVELLGRLSDDKLYEVYAKAIGFIALARDEDFGMTLVEAQAAGTPVIAFNGGGFKETVIDGKTGVFINSTTVDEIGKAIELIRKTKWNRTILQNNARKFSSEVFDKRIRNYIQDIKI